MGKPAAERLEKIQSVRTRCVAIIDACDTLIAGGTKEAAGKAMTAAIDTILPGAIAFKTLGTQGEKAMDSKRRKELQEGRETCREVLASIERELAGDSEGTAEKSAGAIEFRSPDMKNAISEARQRPIPPAFTR